ncbi:MAG: hypothetical protein GDA42_12645 [Ekhidna sp.]|nr:hypothetical protein [Ekhidna sp.]
MNNNYKALLDLFRKETQMLLEIERDDGVFSIAIYINIRNAGNLSVYIVRGYGTRRDFS